MLLAAVLFFGVACSALPTSEDGMQCLIKCALGVSPSVLEHAVPLLSEPDACELVSSILACSKSCPRARVDAVVRQITQLAQKECSSSVSEEQRESTNVASCLLGSALDELKADYPPNVVTAVADASKLTLTFFLKNPSSPPEACSVLYEPYKA